VTVVRDFLLGILCTASAFFDVPADTWHCGKGRQGQDVAINKLAIAVGNVFKAEWRGGDGDKFICGMVSVKFVVVLSLFLSVAGKIGNGGSGGKGR
jgi:hypothetical protein